MIGYVVSRIHGTGEGWWFANEHPMLMALGILLVISIPIVVGILVTKE